MGPPIVRLALLVQVLVTPDLTRLPVCLELEGKRCASRFGPRWQLGIVGPNMKPVRPGGKIVPLSWRFWLGGLSLRAETTASASYQAAEIGIRGKGIPKRVDGVPARLLVLEDQQEFIPARCLRQ